MIRLRRLRTAAGVPAAFRQPRLTTAARMLVDLYYAASTPDKIDFDSKLWKPAKAALKKHSRGKCAYCEAPTDVVAHGDVEHFRPKSKYWWLALCYENYLYSCQICNQSHKGDNFPYSGSAILAPTMPPSKPTDASLDSLIGELVLDSLLHTDETIASLWASEDADLVNPYLEDPEPLLAYEVDDANEEVWLRSAGGSRADRFVVAAIEYLGINREELKRERYINYLALATFKAILDESISVAARQLAEREVLRMQGPREPFAGMRRHFATKWGLPKPP